MAFAQVVTPDTRPLSFKENNLSMNFSVYTEPIEIKPKNDLIYFHYHADKMFQTQGGFTGWLLHGKFESLYADKVLHSQGEFQFGLKSGEWKYWHPNGFLKLVENWKKGIKSGSFAEYNDKGKIIKSGKYRNNIQTGKIAIYDESGKIIQKIENNKSTKEAPKTKKITLDENKTNK